MNLCRVCRLTYIAALLVISGCSSSLPFVADYEPPLPPASNEPPPMPGAIYREHSGILLFEDLKAGRIGDILTVRLREQTVASKSANTSTAKSSSATLTNPSVLGRAVTRDGDSLLGGSLSGQTNFDGEGSSNQSNRLEGDITVTVVERYANGNLRIRGEKWVTLNQGQEFIRLSGIIRPFDIEPDNSVSSTKIADARITYSSKGALAAANRMGLFARFFNSLLSGF